MEAAMIIQRAGVIAFTLHGVLLSAALQTFAASQRLPDEIGANHRAWSREVKEPMTASQQRTRIMEIATGMNYWDGRQWTASEAAFEVTPDAFVANRLQHLVTLNGDLNRLGAVTVVTRDGVVLHSTPVAIGLYDAATGASMIIAGIQSSRGVLVKPNKVVYQNAFRGLNGEGLCADVMYTVDRASFEQDVIITGRIDPEAYGFPKATTQLQIYTEFYEAPRPQRVRRPIRVENREDVRQKLATPDFVDEVLGFGEFVLATGRAFASDAGSTRAAAPVAKEFVTKADRTFLVESVEYASIQKDFEALPPCNPRRAVLNQGLPALRKLNYAAIPKASPHKDANAGLSNIDVTDRLAKVDVTARPGVVIDYIATIGGTLNSAVTFKGDTTYFVSGAVVCNGAATIEGGAVFKFKHNTTAPVGYASLKFNSTLTSRTSSYRPAIFTAVDDDSVGDSLNGYSGSGYQQSIQTDGYANPALWIFNLSSQQLSNLRFSYCQEAIRVEGGSGNTLSHAQLVKCIRGIVITGGGGCGGSGSSTPIVVNNGLFANVASPITISRVNSMPKFYHCTIESVPAITNVVVASASSTCSFYNSIIANAIGVSNGPVSLGGDYNGFYSSPTFGTHQATSLVFPFQAVGAGNYYLTDSNSFRNAGTTVGIAASLLAELKQRTMDPPLVAGELTSIGNLTATLFPRAPRDTDTPDLGYHYDPLDYAFGGVYLTNATLTLAPGTAVAFYYPTGYSGQTYGLALANGAALLSEGSPTSLNRIVKYNTVQEQNGTRWNGTLYSAISSSWEDPPVDPVAQFRFTEWSSPAVDTYHFYGYSGSGAAVVFAHCQFSGGRFLTERPTFSVTNCLFERVDIAIRGFDHPVNPVFQNSLLYGGTLELLRAAGGTWRLQDNILDKVTISQSPMLTHDYNGYVTNATGQWLTNSGGHDVFTNALGYQTGAFGGYYQPTNSIFRDKGSTTANLLGLYYFTVITNNVKETNSTVDLGYHYVAGTNGAPIDFDSDGLPDYREDRNGDGDLDAGESDLGLPDTDYDGQSDAEEVIAGTVPDNAGSVNLVRLGRWRFNTGTLLGEEGQIPTATNGVAILPGWSGNIVSVPPNQLAGLRYRTVETNGHANINCRYGTVRFWFRPKWTGTNLGGTGPTTNSTLVGIGCYSSDATYGLWQVGLNAAGTKIEFITQSNGVSVSYLSPTVYWMSNYWYQVALTYSPSNTSLYTNGILAGTGGGIQNFPSAAVRAAGFTLGRDCDGARQANGAFDELETLNYALPASNILSDYQIFRNSDTDGDDFPDIAETEFGTDPLDADTDNDGLVDGWELTQFNTNPLSADSDGDGMPDGWEVKFGLNPVSSQDAGTDLDQDLLTNLQEYQQGKDPTDFYNGSLPVLTIVSGDNQTGFPATFLPDPMVVRVTTGSGSVISNAPVSFVVGYGQAGLVADTNAVPSSSILLRTDGEGLASAFVMLPPTWACTNLVMAKAVSGTNAITASVIAVTWPKVDPVIVTSNGKLSPVHESVQFWTATPEASIHYSTNGMDATEDSPIASAGENIVLTLPAILKVRAFRSGWVPSDYWEATYGVRDVVAAGQAHTIATMSDGRVWTWGRNHRGQLGNGSTVTNAMPSALASPSALVAAAAGQHHSVILHSNATVFTAGWNGLGQLGNNTTADNTSFGTVPGLSGVRAIAGGSAIDGLPHSVTMALKQDGTVWMWGTSRFGTGNGTTNGTVVPVAVGGLTGIRQIAAGENHMLALKENGRVWSWGGNAAGQLGDGTTTNRLVPIEVPGLSNVVAIRAGSYHSLAVTVEGRVMAWGANTNGQLGDNTFQNRSAPQQVLNLTDVSDIAAGAAHSLALQRSGLVWTWGANGSGQLGNGATSAGRPTVDVAVGVSNVFTIAAGEKHSLAITFEGTLFGWGANTSGQLGDGTTTDRLFPVAAKRYNLFESNADDDFDTLPNGLERDIGTAPDLVDTDGDGISDGQEYLSGGDPSDFYNGVLPIVTIISGNDQQGATSTFLPEPLVVRVTDASDTPLTNAPVNFTVSSGGALVSSTSGGTLTNSLVRRSDANGQAAIYVRLPADLGATSQIDAEARTGLGTVVAAFYAATFPEAVVTPVFSPVPGSYATRQRVVISSATEGATIHYTLNGDEPTENDPRLESPETVLIDRALTLKARAWKQGWTPSAVQSGDYKVTGAVAAGGKHSLGLRSDEKLWAWGTNVHGQLGDGTTTTSLTPVELVSATNYLAVAAGQRHSLGLKLDRTVWTWGWNGHGQLGNGTTVDSANPVQVSGLSNIVAVATGGSTNDAASSHCLALKADGTVVAWGANGSGQLGNGTLISTSAPVAVSSLTGVAAVAVGQFHSLALKADGTVWKWGNDGSGNPSSSTPVQVAGLSGIIGIAAGGYHSLVLKNDGKVWGWGDNLYGQLGDGSTTDRTAPVQVSGLTNVARIAGGTFHSFAINTAGAVLAWGRNNVGQLGDGTTNNRSSFVTIGGVSGVEVLSAGDVHSIAIKTNGSVWSWGGNAAGQLGDGTTQNRLVPTLIAGLNLVEAYADPDNDGLPNWIERQIGTNPNDSDTDDDGLSDGNEVNVRNTDPLKKDTDGDGLQDGAEVNTHLTNPLSPDSDGDGMEDGWETSHGLNPLVNDAAGDLDSDGVLNNQDADPNNAAVGQSTIIILKPENGSVVN
jgi:alpha-tubulin suppressor-like RCC1 family protein